VSCFCSRVAQVVSGINQYCTNTYSDPVRLCRPLAKQSGDLFAGDRIVAALSYDTSFALDNQTVSQAKSAGACCVLCTLCVLVCFLPFVHACSCGPDLRSCCCPFVFCDVLWLCLPPSSMKFDVPAQHSLGGPQRAVGFGVPAHILGWQFFCQ
jgi:hypothetical protein